MTALLTDNEIQTARRRAGMRRKYAGQLASGEAFYFDGQGFSVEKDHWYLVEPTDAELAEIYRLVKRDEPDDLAPARGIVTMMLVGLACWLALGLVIYFTFF